MKKLAFFLKLRYNWLVILYYFQIHNVISNVIIWYLYTLWDDYHNNFSQLPSLYIVPDICMRTFNIYFISTLQIYNTVLSTTVPMLCIASLWLIHFINVNFYLLTTFIISPMFLNPSPTIPLANTDLSSASMPLCLFIYKWEQMGCVKKRLTFLKGKDLTQTWGPRGKKAQIFRRVGECTQYVWLRGFFFFKSWPKQNWLFSRLLQTKNRAVLFFFFKQRETDTKAT